VAFIVEDINVSEYPVEEQLSFLKAKVVQRVATAGRVTRVAPAMRSFD